MWRPDLYAGPENRVCSECEGFEAVNASPAYTSAAFGKPTTLETLPDYADFTATLSLLALLLDSLSVRISRQWLQRHTSGDSEHALGFS